MPPTNRPLLKQLQNTGPFSFKDPKPNEYGAYQAWMKEWVEFDTSAIDEIPSLRCMLPYGVSGPFEKGVDPATVPRRSFDIMIRDPACIAKIQAIDRHNIEVAVANSVKWWGKAKSTEVIEACYRPLMTQDAQGRYLLRTKVNLWGPDPNHTLKVFRWETDPETGAPYTKGVWTDIVKDEPVLATVKLNGFYIKPNEISMMANTSKVVIFPGEVEEFDFAASSDGTCMEVEASLEAGADANDRHEPPEVVVGAEE